MPLQSGGMGDERGRSINSIPHVVASTLNGGEVDDQAAPLVGGDGPHGRSTFNGMDTVVASADRASDGHHGHSSPRGDGADNLIAAARLNGAQQKGHEGWGVRRLTPL